MDAIYARQSVDKKDSLSIEAQINRCKAVVGKKYKVYQDKGFSGKNTNRPEFKKLLDDIKAGKIKKVCVYRLDRFSRSVLDFCQLWEILQQNKVEFCSATENFDTSTPMGRMFIMLLMVFAQSERESTAERVRDSYLHRHSQGIWLGGPAPYGFEIEKTIVDGKKASVLAETENIENVKWIFERFAGSEISLGRLARELNEKGIFGPQRQQWDNVSLSRVLKSPVYVRAGGDVYLYYLSKGVNIQSDESEFDGVHSCTLIGRRDRSKNKYNDLKDQRLAASKHLGVIDSKTWLKVQDKLENNAQIDRGKAGKYSWLTGLLKCAECGYSIKINNLKKENKLKLICSGRSNLNTCNEIYDCDIRDIENSVAEAINKTLIDNPPDIVGENNKKQIEEIIEIDKKIDRLVNSIAESDDVLIPLINKKVEELTTRKNELIAETRKEKTVVEPIDFSKLTFDEKRLVAREFINKISLRNDDIDIEWR